MVDKGKKYIVLVIDIKFFLDFEEYFLCMYCIFLFFKDFLGVFILFIFFVIILV